MAFELKDVPVLLKTFCFFLFTLESAKLVLFLTGNYSYDLIGVSDLLLMFLFLFIVWFRMKIAYLLAVAIFTVFGLGSLFFYIDSVFSEIEVSFLQSVIIFAHISLLFTLYSGSSFSYFSNGGDQRSRCS